MKNLLSSERFRRFLILPPVVIGIALVAFFVRARGQPERTEFRELSRKLSVIQVPQIDVVPRVLGYGTAGPSQEWRAVAEGKGRIVSISTDVQPGAVIKAGEEVLRIDPTEYELAVARLEADIDQVNAQLAELETKEQNYQASLKIEQRSLELAKKTLERTVNAAKTNAVAASEVEKEERNVLSQRQSVQTLSNSLALIPAERKSLKATLAVNQAGLRQANIDLEKTVLKTPFACRVADVTLEKGEFLAQGEVLFEAHSIDATEVEAHVPVDHVRNLINPQQGRRIITLDESATETIRKIFDVRVTVRYRAGDFSAEWEGRFDRIRERLDPQTRTLGLVVAVDKPYEKVVPGVRPPLVKGMFCEVEFRGKPRKGVVVVPRSAVLEEHVYIVNGESRLERRRVEVLFGQSTFAALTAGLQKGEIVVVNDPTPAIEGMLVTPVADDVLLERLLTEARGEVLLR